MTFAERLVPDVAIDVLVDTGRGVRGGAQALEDSFLDVSKPIFPTEGSFCRIVQDLQD